jgi:ribonuclease P protein component
VKRGFRLNRPADFKRVRREGKSFAHPFCVLIALPNELGSLRVGVVAGRAAVGGAVQRNRAKRVLRAAITPLLGRIQPGRDIVLIAKEGLSGKKSGEVQAVLEDLLSKGKLLKN